MKKRRITYGISGLIECQVVIKIGNKSKMNVLFTDGSMTANGVAPAKYTTDNFMIQCAIERSSDYQRGRIYKVSSIELNEEVKIERNQNSAIENDEVKEDTDISQRSSGDEKLSRDEQKKDTDEDPEKDTPKSLKQITFSDHSAAKDYLADTFGINRTMMRSPKQIINQGLLQGIEIIIEE